MAEGTSAPHAWIDFPSDISFVLANIELDAFRYCPIDKAHIATSMGQLAFVDVGLVPFHHRRGKSILNILDITIRFDEQQVWAEMESMQRQEDSRTVVLPQTHREIIRLREVEKKSFDDIALAQGIAPNTVKLHYKRRIFETNSRRPYPTCEE